MSSDCVRVDWVDQVQMTGCTVTGRQQKARRPHGQNIFGDDELTDVSQSLLVATIGRRRACLLRRLRDVRILSDDRGRNTTSENDDRDDDPTLQCDHAAPPTAHPTMIEGCVAAEANTGQMGARSSQNHPRSLSREWSASASRRSEWTH